MTALERFCKWWRDPFKGYTGRREEPAYMAGRAGFEAGYAQGCSDAKAMRGRCKQCAQVIEDGTALTGVVKRRLAQAEAELVTVIYEWRKYSLHLQSEYNAENKLRRLAEEELRVYRENPRLEEAKPRIWRVVMPHTPGVDKDGEMKMEIFQGSPLEALEHFVKVAYEAGKAGKWVGG